MLKKKTTHYTKKKYVDATLKWLTILWTNWQLHILLCLK